MSVAVHPVNESLIAMLRAAEPRLDFFAYYRAKVLSQASNLSIDVEPDDKRLPRMGGLEIKHGIPGLKVKVKKGAFVRVGFDNGDPAKPIAALWDPGDVATEVTLVASKVTLDAGTVELGGSGLGLTDGLVHGSATDNAIGLPHYLLGATTGGVKAKK